MFIERHGQGQQHFLGLHGWSGDRHTFDLVISPLPPEVSFWSADLPGCGNSAPPVEWTIDCIVAEIADAIQQLPAEVTIVGNCSGAILGLLAAQKVAPRIRRFIAIDAFAFWPWYFRLFVTPPFGRYAYFSTFSNPAGRFITNLSLQSKRQNHTNLTEGFAKVDHQTTYRYLELLSAVNGAERFADLKLPIDILFGEKSFEAVRASVAIWQAIWPQARSVCLAGAGHLPILEATPQVREWLFGETKWPSPKPSAFVSTSR